MVHWAVLGAWDGPGPRFNISLRDRATPPALPFPMRAVCKGSETAKLRYETLLGASFPKLGDHFIINDGFLVYRSVTYSISTWEGITA